MIESKLELGCGLIRIGRVWGLPEKLVPTEKEASNYLEFAFSSNIRFFDTAPSYGLSEERLGKFLGSLNDKDRKRIKVATKFGEVWDANNLTAIVNHSYESLKQSLEKSLKTLGKIDILQLHKSTVEVLKTDDVIKAFDLAQSYEITDFGASVSDVDTGIYAVKSKLFSYIQLPYNLTNTQLLPVIEAANNSNKKIIFNRPFGMGVSVEGKPNDKADRAQKSFEFVMETNAKGIILTGTASIDHLKENITAFNSLTG